MLFKVTLTELSEASAPSMQNECQTCVPRAQVDRRDVRALEDARKLLRVRAHVVGDLRPAGASGKRESTANPKRLVSRAL